VPRRRPTALADVRRRRSALAAVALLALIAGAIVGAHSSGDDLHYRFAVASTFGIYGEPLACGGTLRPGQPGVANRSLPCGTRVALRVDDRTTTAPVIDRGPYVAGRDFDLTPATAAALRFDGVGRVEWALGDGK
jgi:rare lipoprotein A (peptidoglycan hydrolase)